MELSMFLETDQEKAKKELDYYGYLLNNAIENMLNGEFSKAAVYHENIANSLRELERMKNTKKMHDEAWLLLKQIEGKQQQEELLEKLIRG